MDWLPTVDIKQAKKGLYRGTIGERTVVIRQIVTPITGRGPIVRWVVEPGGTQTSGWQTSGPTKKEAILRYQRRLLGLRAERGRQPEEIQVDIIMEKLTSVVYRMRQCDDPWKALELAKQLQKEMGNDLG